MSVIFQLGIEDYWHFRKYRMWHDTWYFPSRLVSLFLFGFLAGFWFNRDAALCVFMSGVTTPVYLVYAALTAKSEVRKRLDRYPYLLEPQTVTITVLGVCWKGGPDPVDISWRYFVAIEDIGEYFLLRLKGWYVLMIPKCAFADSAQAQQFLMIALDRWQRAKVSEAGVAGQDAWPPPPQFGG